MDIEKIGQINRSEQKRELENSVEGWPAKSIREAIKLELKEKYGIDKEPPIVDVDIFYSGHEKPGDLEGFNLQETDILLPELAGWEEKNKRAFNMIASGKIEPPSPDFGKTFDTELQDKLYKSAKEGRRVVVAYVDVPKSSDLANEIYDSREAYTAFFDQIFEKEKKISFEDAVNGLRPLIEKWHDTSVVKRENYILDQFGPQIALALVKNPELLKKDRIKVSMMFGAAHEDFFNKLKARNPETSKGFTEGTEGKIVFDYRTEIGRRREDNEPVSEELYARCLIQTILARIEPPDSASQPKTTVEAVRNIRGKIDKLSLNEIKDKYNTLLSRQNSLVY